MVAQLRWFIQMRRARPLSPQLVEISSTQRFDEAQRLRDVSRGVHSQGGLRASGISSDTPPNSATGRMMSYSETAMFQIHLDLTCRSDFDAAYR